MVRNYKHRDGSKPPKPYSDDDLQEAIRRVTAGEPCKQVARLLHIPHRTLRNHVSGQRKTSVSFKQPQNPDLLSTDREAIVKILPKPLVVKQRLCFKKDDIGDLVMR